MSLSGRLALTFVCSLALASPAAAERATGMLTLYVFGNDGLPFTSFSVAGLEARPDEGGVLRAGVPAGAFELVLHLADEGVQTTLRLGLVPIAPGAETEVIVSLQPGREPLVHMEAPPTAAPVLVDEEATTLAPGGGAACDVGRVTGVVRSLEGGGPLSGVTIVARAQAAEAVTDDEGRFALSLPAGTHALSFIHPEHSAEVREGVEVSCGGEAVVQLELSPRAGTLDPLIVKVPHVAGTVAAATFARQKASTITEVLGSEQMSKSGDGDAASALRRVTGLSVVGGKYVYVRGLGERYSSTLMNGASLPSPEPERRVVPLDLFPAGVLDSLVIRKAYSPDLPGEFGGGTVELKTRGIPEDFTFKLSVGTGALFGTTFADGLDYAGGPFDLLGVDGGARALPRNVRDASRDQALLPSDRFSTRGYTPEELEAFGEQLANIWSPETALIPPGFSLGGEVGDRFEVTDELTLGYLAALTYGNSYRTLRYDRRYLLVGQGGALESAHTYAFESTEMMVDGGGMLTLGALYGDDHRLTATTFLGRITDDETRRYQGYNRDVDDIIRITRLRFVERTLLAQQLVGEHALPSLFGLGIDWGYTYALAMRGEPDNRETRYDNERGTEQYLLSNRPEGNSRFFSDLVDHSHDLKLGVSLPFPQWNGLDANVKVGGAFATKSRLVETRRYKFQHKGELTGDPKIIERAPEEVFTPENIRTEGFQFEEFTQPTDNYDANQLIAAGYAMTDLPLWHGLKLQGGVRLEYGSQYVRTFELFNPDNAPVEARIETLDVLPAANLSWELLEGMQLRSSFSITVSRPDFRELSPATFNDVTGGRQTFGNPDLSRALIYAADARWEWYPALGTSLSAAAFYKHFEDPIEQVVIASAQQSITFANADAADNVGAEVEARLDFGLFTEWLEGAYVAGNAAFIYSRVALPKEGITTSTERPLQGQSPFVVNLQAGYDYEELGTSVTALYNVYGRRILEVGAQGAPDVYEEPFHTVDVVLRQRLPWGFTLGVQGRNLLDLPRVETQGDQTLTQVWLGRGVSVSLGWSY